ncbi:MAG: sulfurtransferase TusA family protein [Betaproteobacteria bacterium]|nr:sulfurtransferase TusA family protein [Betaproteobacteria bacterium]
MNTKPTVTLDMSGLSCPAPLIGAKKIVDDMEAGQTLLLVSDCPGTSDDLFAWARHTGNEVAVKEKLGDNKTAYLITRGSAESTHKANVTLDVRGVSCPGPILEAKKMLDGMMSGEILLLVSNCPGTPADVDSWVKTTALELVDRFEIARGSFEFYLRKK